MDRDSDEKQRAECKACEQLPLNMEPESGLHQRGVAVLERGLLSDKPQVCCKCLARVNYINPFPDFTSLYPTVVIANNICYTTIVGMSLINVGNAIHFKINQKREYVHF